VGKQSTFLLPTFLVINICSKIIKIDLFIQTSAAKGRLRHLHAGKINYNVTSVINEIWWWWWWWMHI